METPLEAGDLSAGDITCKLDPHCAKPRVRGLDFGGRGVTVEGAAAPETLSIDLYVNFEYDSAEITQDARITLNQLGTALKDPKLSAYSFKIAGHTDATGSEEYNRQLSQRRADAVAKYLGSEFGISTTRLTSIGYGKSQLIDPTRPEDGVNRRVQVINTGLQ